MRALRCKGKKTLPNQKIILSNERKDSTQSLMAGPPFVPWIRLVKNQITVIRKLKIWQTK